MDPLLLASWATIIGIPWRGNAVSPLTLAEVTALPAVIPLLTAARALGLSRNTAYRLVNRGEFPCRVIKTGDTYRVPTLELLVLLGTDRATLDTLLGMSTNR
ncbi:helix-turn-helix domain-containing protein [Nonomuraea sp. FMUSA5-5]|uniref:Helix-turn-helix domain-containing protein n=1 Tax=Nonomuraea composti TaxID=2720023 RepID=A0ABX1B169_9ACTN|nr:helix-turn-helix domain-containing protein [Nonomuraea sp. FMUSA5-5]NJP91599.1 helix-turn-helix domain-containing protein [Nonomuraea sp. FMUSA5-5]